MKPHTKIASAATPAGEQLSLYKHDRDYYMKIGIRELMNSREHESELALARLGCDHIRDRSKPFVLIGGLGMGYTLRQTLDMLQPDATVIVAELIPDVVRWNRDIIGELTGHPLRDRRVTVKTRDVVELIATAEHAFDAILLDVDNGPDAVTDPENDRLYSSAGIRACIRAMHGRGCLAIWSASTDGQFERRLQREHLHVGRYRVPSHKTGKTRNRCIWVASQDRHSLPLPPTYPSKHDRRKDAPADSSPAATGPGDTPA
jgi:spermidine synthase